MKQPILFLDRDGVILTEPPEDFQIDALHKFSFVPGAVSALHQVALKADYYHILITNQDGLGTESYPENAFLPYQHLMTDVLAGEGFHFQEIHIDHSFPADGKPTRKPGTALLDHLRNDERFDMQNSVVVGDRTTDLQLAVNLGCKAILIKSPIHTYTPDDLIPFQPHLLAVCDGWNEVLQALLLPRRTITHQRYTHETRIDIALNLDGAACADIKTGLGFFDHMLEQLSRHGGVDIRLRVEGDLHIDEHHTIEDTGIALGEAFALALTNKAGIERYGFALPMDDCLARAAIDFGGRAWLIWKADFKREKIGDMPTEMFFHFFKSFSDGARANLHIEASGDNEHHKIEAIFKAFAKSIKQAVRRDLYSNVIPTTKGLL